MIFKSIDFNFLYNIYIIFSTFNFLYNIYTNFFIVILEFLFALLHQEGISSCIKLGVLILSRKTQFIHDFICQLRQHTNLRQKATLIFPLLSTTLASNTPVDQQLLNKIFLEHATQIQKSILKPHKSPEWLKENMKSVSYIVEKCMGKL